LEFSGLRTKALELSVQDWPPSTHLELQASFDSYFAKALIMFDRDGLVLPLGAHASTFLWQRALLSIGDYLQPSSFGNRSFGTNAATDSDSWKRLLRAGNDDASPRRRQHLKTLWDRLDASKTIAVQLEHLITKATNLEPWRAVLVNSPEVMDYCKQQKIRVVSDSPHKIYLLRGAKMSGDYAELFSYALHEKLLDIEAELTPFTLQSYQVAWRQLFEPHVSLKLDCLNGHLEFAIEMADGKFMISVKREALDPVPEIAALLRTMAFIDSQKGDDLELSCSRESILVVLEELANRLNLLLKAKN